MDNGPARKAGTAESLFKAGEESGDPFEISTIRREVTIFRSAWGVLKSICKKTFEFSEFMSKIDLWAFVMITQHWLDKSNA